MSYKEFQKWAVTPNQGKPFLSVVIPCYNEEERVIPTIGAIASTLCCLDIDWELVVVDDGSKDKTVELIENLEMVNLRLVKLGKNQGKGAAVKAGVHSSNADWVLFTDADNSTPIEEIERFLPYIIDDSKDIICGSRALASSTVEGRSGLRQLATKTLSSIVKLGLNLPVKDSQCGFKAMKRSVALRLLQLQQLTGFSFDLELLFLAKKLGYNIAEVGVHWVDAPGSKVETLKETWRFLQAILTIRDQHSGLTPSTLAAPFKPSLPQLAGGLSS